MMHEKQPQKHEVTFPSYTMVDMPKGTTESSRKPPLRTDSKKNCWFPIFQTIVFLAKQLLLPPFHHVSRSQMPIVILPQAHL